MDNGVNPYDAATLALFSNGRCGGIGVGGGGGLCCGNEYLAAGAHADGTAVKEAVDANGRMSSANLDRISAQNLESRTNDRFAATIRTFNNSEFRTIDRLRDVERLIVDGQKEAAKCCCESQLRDCENTAKIMAEIKAVEARGIERERADLKAELTALKTQIACGCCPPCGG